MACKYLMETGQCKIGMDLAVGKPDPSEEYLHKAIEESQRMGRCEKDYENCSAYHEWEKRGQIF